MDAKNESNNPQKQRWIVTGARGWVHGRIDGAPEPLALQIARTTFPDVAAERLILVDWCRAPGWMRGRARTAVHLTPEQCVRNGLISAADLYAAKLQARFMASGGHQ